jgi:hypothetical protein
VGEQKRDKPGGARGLAGGGPSIVGISGSMRARDVSKPTAKDAAAAEKRVVIRRAPRDEPPRPGPPKSPEPRTR